ncbi:hypothetical protein HXX76_006059 [Chlamydomonas incerta]|uniref:Nudix hydrolase domain-containing protein n=1 Tax=Chlamydomonas incerta TaxID=51695 RepID=A0A835T1U0_CHLIN|nr:hypothetical protein HXX76_006059 [Chlamydomonas incerta]|eukprot:KAG2437407.1 hypothetical protein HXX76_006059 [Chlamydomonas incerta]
MESSRLPARVDASGDTGVAGTSSPAAASTGRPWRVADASTDGQRSVFGWKTQFKSNGQYAAAGVMPFAYRQENGELYVLLSLQRTKKKLKAPPAEAEAAAVAGGSAPQTLAYAFLGGKIEDSDGGDARLTAAREAHEETHGLLHTEHVLGALCGLQHDCMVADDACAPSGSTSTNSTSGTSSTTSSTSRSSPASDGGDDADVPAPFEYFPSGRYTLFALHLPDAWRLPEACEAKLRAGEKHPEAEKVLGLEWVSLRQLGSIKRGQVQHLRLGSGLPGSTRQTTEARCAAAAAPAAAASSGSPQPAASSSAAAAPEAAASAQERPGATTNGSAGATVTSTTAASASAATSTAADASTTSVADEPTECRALAHHFLADMLRNKRLLVGIHNWLLCMRRHLRQWHGFQGTRPEEAAEEEAALAKARMFSVGLGGYGDDEDGAGSDGEAPAVASAMMGELEQLFSDLPSSLQVRSQGTSKQAMYEAEFTASAEAAHVARVEMARRAEVAKAAKAAAAAAAKAAAMAKAADDKQAPPPRRPPPPLLPLPAPRATPDPMLASRLPIPPAPLPTSPPPASLPRPSSALVSAAASPTAAASPRAATSTTRAHPLPSYALWRMDGTRDAREGLAHLAETRLRLQPAANARGPSSTPPSAGQVQGQGQDPAGSPVRPAHAQGSPAAAKSHQGGGDAAAGLVPAPVAVWKIDGEVEWGTSGRPGPATTVLKQQPRSSAVEAAEERKPSRAAAGSAAGRPSRTFANQYSGSQEGR